MRPNWLFVCCLLSALSISPIARAGEPSAADRETARALLQDGDKAMDAGNAEGALKSYEAAHALLDLPATGMAVVRARVALGQLVQARDAALAVLRIPKPAEAEKPANVEARREAEKVAADLAARIPSTQVAVEPAGVKPTVEIDGVVLPDAAQAEKVNPGRRKVRVTANGYRDFEEIVEIKERESKQLPVKLEVGSGGPTAPPSGEGAGGGDGPPPVPDAQPRDGGDEDAGMSPLVIGGIVVGGVGVVGVAVGAAFGVLTMNDLNDAEDDPSLCPNKACTPSGRETVDGAKTKGIISTVGFAVGGAALATGVVLVVLGVTSQPDAPTTGVWVAPGPGDAGVGLGVTF